VMRMAPAAIAAGRELELEVLESIPISGEREAIAGALRNLIDNAVRAAPLGSTVRVRVGPGACLSVADQGPGIDAADLPQIFDRYRQGDQKTSGSAGLGLSIVKKTMSLDAAPGEGSVFTLEFSSGKPPLSSALTGEAQG
jgi:signal transduction histidine kinase